MATKKELEEMATDLFKRLGGNRTKDGRIVRALLLQWKSAELNAAQHRVQADGACKCAPGEPFTIVSGLQYCLTCSQPRR